MIIILRRFCFICISFVSVCLYVCGCVFACCTNKSKGKARSRVSYKYIKKVREVFEKGV